MLLSFKTFNRFAPFNRRVARLCSNVLNELNDLNDLTGSDATSGFTPPGLLLAQPV
jgi:hypothetical protein